VNRRSLLASGVGLLAGCRQRDAGRASESSLVTEFETCGPSESTPCTESDIPTDLTSIDGFKLRAGDDVLAVVLVENRTIVGKITSIERSECRELTITEQRIESGTVSITIRNRRPRGFTRSCPEVGTRSYYRLVVPEIASATTLSLTHLRQNGDKELQRRVPLEEATTS